MALTIFGQALEQLESLLPVLMSTDAGMCFVDDHELRAGSGEALAALLCLNIIEADNRVGICIEQGLRRW
jgi:hypothetical protein